MVFAAVKHFHEGKILKIFLRLKVQKYIICLVGIQKAAVSVIEQQLTLS
jgi:hypothetical protein